MSDESADRGVVHWAVAAFGNHGGSSLSSFHPSDVTCPRCLQLLERRGPGSMWQKAVRADPQALRDRRANQAFDHRARAQALRRRAVKAEPDPWLAVVEAGGPWIHFKGLEFGSHGGTLRHTRYAELVSCPWCLQLMEARGWSRDPAKREKQREKAEQRAEDKRLLRARVEAKWEQRRREQSDPEWRRDRQRERREKREARQMRDWGFTIPHGWGIGAALRSTGRATPLSPELRALSSEWPDVDMREAAAAAFEQIAEAAEDPEHWRDVRSLIVPRALG